MTSAKAQIVALLPKLAPAELAEIITAAKLAGSLGAIEPQPSLHSDWVLDGIATYLIRKGLLAPAGAIQSLRRRDAYKPYLSKLPAVAVFLARLERDQLGGKSRYRTQLGLVCADALADLLQKRGYFSVSGMLSQIDKLPEALDEAYPSYIESGLFGMFLRGKAK